MPKKTNHIVNFNHINEMLDDDLTYMKDFCKAAVISFEAFKDDFYKAMSGRNINKLRKTGHRIKPVVQMLEVNQIIDEYEKAKKILSGQPKDTDVKASIKRVYKLCDAVITDFNRKLEGL